VRCEKHQLPLGTSYCNLCEVEHERAEIERLLTERSGLKDLLDDALTLLGSKYHTDGPKWAEEYRKWKKRAYPDQVEQKTCASCGAQWTEDTVWCPKCKDSAATGNKR